MSVIIILALQGVDLRKLESAKSGAAVHCSQSACSINF